jgi:indolepyruvate ferredoxin oxidoreductase beta subunit
MNKATNKNAFNIVISGIGGQGIITLTRILSYAAIIEKMDVKTSELHGLSQRGGSVETHIRFGKDIYSPLVRQGGADLIISLDAQEELRVSHYASKQAVFVSVSKIPKPKLEKEILIGVYLLGYASYKKMLPLKPQTILKAIEEVVPKKHLDINKKAFNLAV